MKETKDMNPEKKSEKEKELKAHEAGIWAIIGLGLYFVVLTAFFIYVVIEIWLAGENGSLSICLFGVKDIPLGSELRLIFIVALMGALGSLIHAMTSFASYIGNRKLARSWIWWFILRPFIAIPLALIFYFVVRGGFFTVSAGTEAISTFGIAGLAGLVGMFSKQAIDKLKEVFENLFKTTQPDQRADKLKE
jgi:hypothetical protein